mmetsp:Transcript_13744/g.40866  ORF Transcript_13744/g.40866 Transcript_13744/m.40866 type:complete len:343 (-) Transcript_13744:186-1214(-)
MDKRGPSLEFIRGIHCFHANPRLGSGVSAGHCVLGRRGRTGAGERQHRPSYPGVQARAHPQGVQDRTVCYRSSDTGRVHGRDLPNIVVDARVARPDPLHDGNHTLAIPFVLARWVQRRRLESGLAALLRQPGIHGVCAFPVAYRWYRLGALVAAFDAPHLAIHGHPCNVLHRVRRLRFHEHSHRPLRGSRHGDAEEGERACVVAHGAEALPRNRYRPLRRHFLGGVQGQAGRSGHALVLQDRRAGHQGSRGFVPPHRRQRIRLARPRGVRERLHPAPGRRQGHRFGVPDARVQQLEKISSPGESSSNFGEDGGGFLMRSDAAHFSQLVCARFSVLPAAVPPW